MKKKRINKNKIEIPEIDKVIRTLKPGCKSQKCRERGGRTLG
jgi:hypothetical protein